MRKDNPRQKRFNQIIPEKKTHLAENIKMCTALGTQSLYWQMVVINLTGRPAPLRKIKWGLLKHREGSKCTQGIPQSSQLHSSAQTEVQVHQV